MIEPTVYQRNSSIGGIELFDCEDEEIQGQENEEISDDEDQEENVVASSSSPIEQAPDETTHAESDLVTAPASVVPIITSSSTVSLSNLTSNPDIIADALFLGKLEELIKPHKTSKLFTPYIS